MLLAVFVMLPVGALSAETTSGAMAVGAVVEESCHVDVGPMAFGTLPGPDARIDAHTTVMVACTPATGYVISLDEGRQGDGGERRMVDRASGRFLRYDIYSDAARTRRWGATPASAVSAVAPAHGRREHDVFARAAAGQAEAGSYADSVTVTVAF